MSILLVLGAMRNVMLLIGARKRTAKLYLLEFRSETLFSVAQTLKDIFCFSLRTCQDSKINYLTSYLTHSVLSLFRAPRSLLGDRKRLSTWSVLLIRGNNSVALGAMACVMYRGMAHKELL